LKKKVLCLDKIDRVFLNLSLSSGYPNSLMGNLTFCWGKERKEEDYIHGLNDN